MVYNSRVQILRAHKAVSKKIQTTISSVVHIKLKKMNISIFKFVFACKVSKRRVKMLSQNIVGLK